MVSVDLAVEAAAEVERLTKARGLAAGAGSFPPDGTLIGIARRSAVRRALGGRVLLLWRLAYEDSGGRLVESALVAVTIERSGARLDVRHAGWSNASLLALVHDRCGAWCASVQDTVHRFTATRVTRERAIVAARATSTTAFQPGLFDRRADRAHIAHSKDAAERGEQIAARMKAVLSAGAISLLAPELLLVLIPRDAARM
jgi:hypothetical protein